MGKKLVEVLVDDLNGKEATHEGVTFSFQGRRYKVDLTTANYNRLENALRPFIEAGTYIGGHGPKQAERVGRENPPPSSHGAVDPEVREDMKNWMAARGIKRPHAKYPRALVERYWADREWHGEKPDAPTLVHSTETGKGAALSA